MYLLASIGIIKAVPRVFAAKQLPTTEPTDASVALYFGNKDYTGTIPTQFGKLSKVEYFDVSENKLEGTIPTGKLFARIPRI